MVDKALLAEKMVDILFFQNDKDECTAEPYCAHFLPGLLKYQKYQGVS